VTDVRALFTRARARCRTVGSAESQRRAAAELDDADRLATSLSSPELTAEITRHRGNCALFRRDYEGAERYFRDALAQARRQNQPFLEAKAAGSLGQLKVRMGQFDEASEWFDKALSLASALKVDLDQVKTLTNLGWCYYELGDYDRALEYLSGAEALARERGYAGERLLALQNIGNAHYRLGRLEDARNRYRSALAVAEELGDKKPVAELVGNLGQIALDQGRYDEAEARVGEALRIMAEIEDLPGREHSRLAQGRILAGRGEHAKAEAVYGEILASPHSERALLWETRASRASLLVEVRRTAEAEAEFRRAFAMMDEYREELRKAEHKMSFFASLRRFYDDYVDFLVETGREGRALEVADESRARLLREKLRTEGKTSPVSVSRLQEAARAHGVAVLFYWMGRERSFLWVVTKGGARLHRLPDEEEIRRHVEAHQSLVLRARDPLGEGAPDAEWLYHSLVGPAEGSIPRGSRVLFVPDGPLHQINPETLVVSSPERHYWVEDVTLATTPSLALLSTSASGRRPPRSASILIIGDPVTADDEFPRLPQAGKEVEQIAGQFSTPQRTVYTGTGADPTVYEASDPGRYAFIHFAAHAKANSEKPLDSAVILSPKNESYKLYAREILDIRPLHADLVSLSACRSAGSRAYAGEGLVGLAWAFLSAGAANVVAGLWNVEDVSTARLMNELYRGLNRGLSPADALREAKLGLLRSGTAYRKPFYWAPFMIYTRRDPARNTAG
jgi:CHAT domain-containing protein/Tfp pilus assembly protein PilF